MADYPDMILIVRGGQQLPPRWDGFPHTLALLPEGVDLRTLADEPRMSGVFLIEPGDSGEVLNGIAMPAYMQAGAPIVLHARKARDLRPFLRRAEAFLARGYKAEVVA